MSREPTVTCETCGDTLIVTPDGRTDNPVDAARRKLAKRCKAKGHICQSRYLAGTR